jgi:hypothetical protein
VFHYSPEFPRAMRVLSLFSSIVIMLFVQSVTYNIADPDDGSCESCEDESCCLSLKSTLNSNEDRCYWAPFARSANISSSSSSVSSAIGSPGCHFRDIEGDMTRMFIVAMISAVVSAPLALSVQYLIMNVLSKYTSLTGEEAAKERAQKKSRRSKRISRRVGVTVAPSASSSTPEPHPSASSDSVELDERCGRTLLDDLNNLSGELFAHYTSLLAQGQGNRKAKEFRSKFSDLISIPLLTRLSLSCFFSFSDAWGSLVVERSPEDRSKLLEASSWSSRFSSFFSRKSAAQHEQTTTDLVKDLGRVRKEVAQEYRRLEGLKTSDEDLGLTSLRRRKRLMCLFVRDLSSGVSGEVLARKSQRDSEMSRPGGGSGKLDRVPWQLKWMAGLFVGLLDAGMLFYVYLFAMNQSHSRQQAWFVSFVMWLGFEIFLSSTALVLVLHLLVPLYVWSDVAKVKKGVLEDFMKFRKNQEVGSVSAPENDIETGEGTSFNAAKYFFTSWRVASLLPKLPESQLVLQFSTPLPRKMFGKEEDKVAKEYEDDVISSAVAQIVLYFLVSLLHDSSLVQDIVIQTVCNGGLGSLCLLLVRLWNIHPWLAVLVALMLLLCLWCLGRFSLSGLAKKLQENEAEGMASHSPSPPPANTEGAGVPHECLTPELRMVTALPSVPPSESSDENDDEEDNGEDDGLFSLGGVSIWEFDASSLEAPAFVMDSGGAGDSSKSGAEDGSSDDEDDEEDDDDGLFSLGDVSIEESNASSSEGVLPSLSQFSWCLASADDSDTDEDSVAEDVSSDSSPEIEVGIVARRFRFCCQASVGRRGRVEGERR